MNPSPFPSRETRATQREAKRLALLQAAVRLFNERGFHATSLEDVAASLGVTKPVVYHYLGTKDQVLFECVRIGLEQLKQAVESSADLPGSGLDRLEFALRRYAEINMEDFGACVVRTGDTLLSPQSRAQFRTLKRANNAALQALVQAAADDGSAMVEDVPLATFTLAGALNWPANWFREDGPRSRQDVARDMVRVLLCGLKPR